MHDKQILHCIISVTSRTGTEFDFRAYGFLQQQCIFIICVQGAFFTDGVDGNYHFPQFLSSLEQRYLPIAGINNPAPFGLPLMHSHFGDCSIVRIGTI